MILSDVLLLMTSQGPADHRAGQRDRCAPLESGFQWKDTRQSPLSAGPILSSRNPPDSSGSTLTCRGQLTGAWVSPRSQSSEQAHWSQPGCGPRRLADSGAGDAHGALRGARTLEAGLPAARGKVELGEVGSGGGAPRGGHREIVGSARGFRRIRGDPETPGTRNLELAGYASTLLP